MSDDFFVFFDDSNVVSILFAEGEWVLVGERPIHIGSKLTVEKFIDRGPIRGLRYLYFHPSILRGISMSVLPELKYPTKVYGKFFLGQSREWAFHPRPCWYLDLRGKGCLEPGRSWDRQHGDVPGQAASARCFLGSEQREHLPHSRKLGWSRASIMRKWSYASVVFGEY